MGLFAQRRPARWGDLIVQGRHTTICLLDGHTRASNREKSMTKSLETEDEIIEWVQAIRETELLYGPGSFTNLFRLCTDLLSVIMQYSAQVREPNALCSSHPVVHSKFLRVSSQFCAHHDRLPFKITESSLPTTGTC
ncbi:hypothetical protein CPC08DRAFT_237496 [Agrocybe pediades]|nr:hypothetical protein CPC08DRAFT_237496 [Agrocybe pediades]